MDHEKRSSIVPRVSFIIIARNEEGRIRTCLDSVTRAASLLESSEIVLVDSKSVDRTIEIAATFPIIVVKLGPCQRPSPAAGRYVGMKYCTGEYIMFVDGDMELCRNWVLSAAKFLEENSSFSAVFGKLVDSKRNHILANDVDAIGDGYDAPEKVSLDVNPAPTIGGSAMVREEHLRRAGGLNPYVTGDEEAELSYRIHQAGHLIGESRETMAIHPIRGFSTAGETSRRWRYGYFTGHGIVLRTSLQHDGEAFMHHMRRMWFYLIYSLWTASGLAFTILSLVLHTNTLLLFWLIVSSAGIAMTAARHGFRNLPSRFLSSFLIGIGIWMAFFRRPSNPSSYPNDDIRVK